MRSAYDKLGPIDPCLLSFLSHHGIDGAFEILSSLGDARAEETHDAFQKIVRDFWRTPPAVDKDDGMADGKAGKVLLGGEKKPGTMKREHGPVEGEQDPKKPRMAEGSCDKGESPEGAGTDNPSV